MQRGAAQIKQGLVVPVPVAFSHTVSCTSHLLSAAHFQGAIAGLVLGGLFALAALIPVCCHSKCGTVTLLLFAALTTAATVGCFYRYKTHTLGADTADTHADYNFTYGFFVACATFALSVVAVISSCCMNSKRDEYFNLA